MPTRYPPSRPKTLVPALSARPDWMARGLCHQQGNLDICYPEGAGRVGARGTQQAKELCASCPVVADCLAWALDRQERHGVWGGLSERERDQLLAQPPTSSTPGPAGVAA